MASPTRSWHENPPPSQLEMEVAVEQSMERLRSWTVSFVHSQLGPSTSPYDFVERVAQCLTPRWQGPLDPIRVDEAVRKTLQKLVHNDRRTVIRRARKYQSTADIEKVPDPRSLDFASQLELDSAMSLVWEHIRNERPDYKPIVDSLFGFVDEDELSVKDLANRLGILPDTLKHRLSRFYAELRTRLSRAG
jgi:DNA-directed RNA polymerase specialized sigma24 family protein